MHNKEALEKRVFYIDVNKNNDKSREDKLKEYVDKIREKVRNNPNSGTANILITDAKMEELCYKVIDHGKDSLSEEELKYYLDGIDSIKDK